MRKQTTRTKTRPAGQPTESSVDLPLQQSLITALFITLFVGTIVYSFRLPVEIPLVTLGISLLVTWLWRLKLFDGLLFAVEKTLQTDITGDGQIGKPSSLVVVNGAKARATTASQVKAHASEDKLQELETFVERCYTVGTSESAQGIKPNNRAAYLAHKDVLFRLGLAENKTSNPKAGWKMTTDRSTALQTIAEHVTET